MNREPKDTLDHVIDEVLGSMVSGEPRRANATSVRRALSEHPPSRLPMWFAAAAVLLGALGIALMGRAPAPPLVTRSAASPSPVEARPTASPSPDGPMAMVGERPVASRPIKVAMTSDPPYEGLPRLTIASIDLPEPLSTSGLGADPILIPRLEIAPLSVSSLSGEQEH